MKSNFSIKKIGKVPAAKSTSNISSSEINENIVENDAGAANLDHVAPMVGPSEQSIGNTPAKMSYDEMVASKPSILENDENTISVTKNISKRSKKDISKENSVLVNNQNVDPNTQNGDILLDGMEFDLILKQLQEILKSPSPFTLYKKSNELKEYFSIFINNLAKKVSEGFNSQNKTVILSMYYNASYQQVWLYYLKNYFEDSKYFDRGLYFKTVTLFDKEKQILAKGLLKMYIGNEKEDVNKLVNNKNYKTKIKYDTIKETFDILELSKYRGQIEKQYLNENKIELFLKELTTLPGINTYKMFEIFSSNLKDTKEMFSETYDIFSDIAKNYLKDINQKDRNILSYINSEENSIIKKVIDNEIKVFFKQKHLFYEKMEQLIANKNSTERGYFWSYIKTQLINVCFKEITLLFYWNRRSCRNRNEWSQLKGNFSLSDKSNFQKEIKSIMDFKRLILQLDESILSPFIKPIIYSIVSEKISINQKDLLKLRYLMTLILSDNFSEYKTMFNFFEDLETFLDFNMVTNGASLNINFRKLKIFTADIIILGILLTWLYIYAPVGVFIGVILLAGSFFREHFFTFVEGIEWNFGTRVFALIILVISSFFWITNLSKTKTDISNLSAQIEKIGIYKTDETVAIVAEKVGKLEVPEMVVNILQWKK